MEALGQIVREPQVPFVRSGADVRVLNVLEGREQPLLFILGQCPVSHAE
jgi:hypothetical protein